MEAVRLTRQNGTQEETVERIRLLAESFEKVIAVLRVRIVELQDQEKEVQSRLEAQRNSLDKFLSLRNTIAHVYPNADEQRQLFADWLVEDGQKRIAGLPLGEAMEAVLVAEGRELTQDELVVILEDAGLPLGPLAGRRLHAASLSNERIRKVGPGTYVYVAPAVELVPA